jgi:phosphatidylserine/phosphatidylglycerophosphate/cardiolipin synthase-like enzyme
VATPEHLTLFLYYDVLQTMPDAIFPEPISFPAAATPLLGTFFYNELMKSIDNAGISIYSVQYQWKWNIHERFSKVQQLGAAILRAKKRGVEVNVILNQESPRRNLSKINGITGDYLAREGVNVKLLQTPGLLHTKLWVIDYGTTFIGSHNVSGRSLTVNEEVSVKIEDNYFAKFMHNYFDYLWKLK